MSMAAAIGRASRGGGGHGVEVGLREEGRDEKGKARVPRNLPIRPLVR